MLIMSFTGKPVSNNEFYSAKHWGSRAAIANRWHKAIMKVITDGKKYGFYGEKVRIEFFYNVGVVRIDLDNLSATEKLIIDAIKEAGVITDDSKKYVTEINKRFRGAEYFKDGSFCLVVISLADIGDFSLKSTISTTQLNITIPDKKRRNKKEVAA